MTVKLHKQLCKAYFGTDSPPRAFNPRTQGSVRRISDLVAVHQIIVENPGITAAELRDLRPDLNIRSLVQQLRKLQIVELVEWVDKGRHCGYTSMIA